jgi:hypothetical protein
MITTTINTKKYGNVKAVYNGGAYADIYLYGEPVDVFNYYDYEAGNPTLPENDNEARKIIRQDLKEWIRDEEYGAPNYARNMF